MYYTKIGNRIPCVIRGFMVRDIPMIKSGFTEAAHEALPKDIVHGTIVYE